jgi:hypothetical protein
MLRNRASAPLIRAEAHFLFWAYAFSVENERGRQAYTNPVWVQSP